MAKYRKILIAYDGSSSARNALQVASHLARQEKSWIKVVAVVPTYEGDLEMIGMGNIRETIAGLGKTLLTEAQEIADREEVHILTDLEQGEPYDKIVHVADDENCDLIVVGRRGLSSLERELMGGVTARVIGHTARDVLVVPDHTQLAWGHILLATDGSKHSEAAVAKAFELAKDYHAALTVISAVNSYDEFYSWSPKTMIGMLEETKSILDEVEKRAEAEGVAVETVIKEGQPHQAITGAAAKTGADLILMGSHGRKGLTRLLMGSVTERVIGFAPCPVMVCHSPLP